MRRVIVRYKLKPGQTEENERLIRAVYVALQEQKPAGLRYATFKAADGVSFVHMSETVGENPLFSLPAFKAFTAGVKARCVEEPVTTELQEIGSYQFW